MPKLKDKLHVRWSNKDNALLYHHPDHASNGGFLAGWFEYEKVGCSWPRLSKTFVEELEARGYDPKTLKFQISKKIV